MMMLFLIFFLSVFFKKNIKNSIYLLSLSALKNFLIFFVRFFAQKKLENFQSSAHALFFYDTQLHVYHVVFKMKYGDFLQAVSRVCFLK